MKNRAEMSVDHEVHHDVNFQDVSISSTKKECKQKNATKTTASHKSNRGVLLRSPPCDYLRMNVVPGGRQGSYLALVWSIRGGKAMQLSDMPHP